MHEVKLVISVDHLSLGAARRAGLYSVTWQRCQFHFQKNAQCYVPKQSMRKDVAADIRVIFNVPDKKTAEQYLQVTIQKYARSAPRLPAWMVKILAKGLIISDFSLEHRRSIRTTNSLEMTKREINRRTRVVGVFPNEASCLRLVSARLMKISKEWQIGKRYCAGKSFNC